MPKKTIMLVDDEYLILETESEILKDSGYNVVTALSGKEAIKKLKKAKVDLALLDIMMPGMSGIELTKKIREKQEFKELKIAYVSIIPLTQSQKNELKKFRILDYIQKPFEPKDLVKRVNKLIKN